MALLGEMYYKSHGVGSWCKLPREGGVAYAPQETWVLNDTIRVRAPVDMIASNEIKRYYKGKYIIGETI